MQDPPPARDTSPSPTPRDRAWVEVDSAAILQNLNRIQRSVGPDVRPIPMVKANGYGLGVERVIQALAPARPFGYGVATVAEGIELRRIGVTEPVMVYSPVPPDALAPAVASGLIPAISDLASLAALEEVAASAAPVSAAFQIEVDTGIGRAGFALDNAATGWWTDILRATESGLQLFGVFTHLHSADQPDLTSARRQIQRFDEFVRAADGIGPDTLVHYANSAGSLRLPSGTANAVRPGIYLYGGAAGHVADPPDPVAAVRARVALVRDVPPAPRSATAQPTARGGASAGRRRESATATGCRGYSATGAGGSCTGRGCRSWAGSPWTRRWYACRGTFPSAIPLRLSVGTAKPN